MKIALCQIGVSPDKDQNIQEAQKAIQVGGCQSHHRYSFILPEYACLMQLSEIAANTVWHAVIVASTMQEAAQAGAKLVVLPEMWNCPYSNESFPKYAEDIDAGKSQSVSAMSASAKQCGITLVAGSIPESSNGKLYNTCCIFDDQGKLLAKHRKVSTALSMAATLYNLSSQPMQTSLCRWLQYFKQCSFVASHHVLAGCMQVHLFDIDIPGKITFRESETLTQGETFTVVDTPACRLGIGICYDLRFPELAMVYAQRGVQLIVYPGKA